MKPILLMLASGIVCVPAFAQWDCNSSITFDNGDALYPVAITIDTANHHHNIWQIGRPHKAIFSSALSAPNAIVTDTLNPYAVGDTSVFILSAPLSLANNEQLLELQFSYRLDIDTSAIASVEISADKGGHWSNVTDSLPANFYWDGDTANLSSSTNGWARFFMAYRCSGCVHESDSILFRFTFISDSVPSAKDGWIIDNIGLSYWCETGQTINYTGIYPNPAISELNIFSSVVITNINVINVLGQMVYNDTYNNNTVQMNVESLIAGIYFLKINGHEVRKFVKE